jgi:transposase-like protein
MGGRREPPAGVWVSRLTEAWQAEHAEWSERSLADVDDVYLSADGAHFTIRLEEDRLCFLVILNVRPEGTKELVALADGYRESTDSWAELLRGLKERGLAATPALAVGDGTLGFWGELRPPGPLHPPDAHRRRGGGEALRRPVLRLPKGGRQDHL